LAVPDAAKLATYLRESEKTKPCRKVRQGCTENAT
jgi:hypothetical protein